MTRIDQGQVDEGDARIELFATPGQDTYLVTGVRHQPGVPPEDTLYTAHHGRGCIMEQGSIHGNIHPLLAWIARSIKIADDQPKMGAALGGLAPVSG